MWSLSFLLWLLCLSPCYWLSLWNCKPKQTLCKSPLVICYHGNRKGTHTGLILILGSRGRLFTDPAAVGHPTLPEVIRCYSGKATGLAQPLCFRSCHKLNTYPFLCFSLLFSLGCLPVDTQFLRVVILPRRPVSWLWNLQLPHGSRH